MVVVEVVVMVVEVFVSAMLLTETLQNRQQNAMRWMYFRITPHRIMASPQLDRVVEAGGSKYHWTGVLDSALDAVGNTPLIRLQRIRREEGLQSLTDPPAEKYSHLPTMTSVSGRPHTSSSSALDISLRTEVAPLIRLQRIRREEGLQCNLCA
jgi:hypothetical protein